MSGLRELPSQESVGEEYQVVDEVFKLVANKVVALRSLPLLTKQFISQGLRVRHGP